MKTAVGIAGTTPENENVTVFKKMPKKGDILRLPPKARKEIAKNRANVSQKFRALISKSSLLLDTLYAPPPFNGAELLYSGLWISNPGGVSALRNALAKHAGGIVLGCIEADVCKERLALQQKF